MIFKGTDSFRKIINYCVFSSKIQFMDLRTNMHEDINNNDLKIGTSKSAIQNSRLIITDECINCEACRIECPSNAIYHPADKIIIKRRKNKSVLQDHFLIDQQACTLCRDCSEIKCVAICPVDAILI